MNKSLFLSAVTGALLSVSLNACASTHLETMAEGDILLPTVSVPSDWDQQASNSVVVPYNNIDVEMGWLARFDDPNLNDLVTQALAHNPNLKRLGARLEQANAQSDKAKSALFPFLGASAGATRTDNFEGSNASSADLNIGVNALWEPDLWGRISASSLAGENRAEAALEDYKSARQILAASVIENYFLVIEARRLADVSQRNLDALNETLGFVTVQYERGLRSGQDISLIRADVASAKVSFNRAEGAARDALRALNILMGRYPQSDRLIEAALPDVPTLNAIGQPADILTNRPDLRAAQYRVDAAYATHRSTQAAQKPNLSLGGVIGTNSSGVGDLFNPASMAGTLLANVTAPLFDGGARRADTDIARADIEAALATYEETALDAFRDVERQIDQGAILAEQDRELTGALSDARDALRFTQFRYESGESDLLNVLSVQQRVSFIEGQLVSTRRARLIQYINLALALGITPQDANPDV